MQNTILITSPSLDSNDNVSGISSVVRDVVANSRHKFIHLSLGRKDGEQRNLRWGLKQVQVYFTAIKTACLKRFQVVHLNVGLEKMSIYRDSIMSLIFKGIFNKKIVLHVHGGYYLSNDTDGVVLGFCLRQLLRTADTVILLSEWEKGILTERFGRLNFVVLPNVVDTKTMSDFCKVKNGTTLRLAFLGRVNVSKGVFVICESFQYLKEYFDIIELDIYGTGPDLNEMLTRLSGYDGLKYSYKGVVSGDEKWLALHSTDVFMLPSIHSEGMPISILEAMASGAMVIVTNDASITSVVDHGINGIVVEKGNAKELAQRIEDVILGKIDAQLIGETARSYIEQHVSMDQYVANLDEIYVNG